MGTISLKYRRRKDAAPDEYWIPKRDFKKFGPALLELGDVSADGERFDAVVAVLDLKEFTPFCDQRDHNPEILKFLDEFITWLFRQISHHSLRRNDGDQAVLWSPLPFFGKFLGDGLLLLWDARNLTADAKGNIVADLQVICSDYERRFFPKIKKRFTKAPSALRCGVAFGQVISIGKYNDFVGLCINLAARLQKLGDGSFSFAFTKRGFEHESWHSDFRLIKVPIRGIHESELLYVLKSEFRGLPKTEQKKLLP